MPVAPIITGSGGAILSGGAKAGLGGALAGGATQQGVINSLVGSALAGSAPELLKALFGPGGAARTAVQQQAPGSKFTVTAAEVRALTELVQRENFKINALRMAGFPAGPLLNVDDILNKQTARVNEQLNRATERKQEELRVQGELNALPQAFASMGQMGTAQSRIAEAALSKVLEGALPAPYLSNLGNVRQITK